MINALSDIALTYSGQTVLLPDIAIPRQDKFHA
jgi:hypothetical protein